MSKQKKKRNKPYRGQDAKITRPTIVRVSAEQRGPLKQWWVEHKRAAKPLGIIVAILLAIILLGIGIVGLFHG